MLSKFTQCVNTQFTQQVGRRSHELSPDQSIASSIGRRYLACSFNRATISTGVDSTQSSPARRMPELGSNNS